MRSVNKTPVMLLLLVKWDGFSVELIKTTCVVWITNHTFTIQSKQPNFNAKGIEGANRKQASKQAASRSSRKKSELRSSVYIYIYVHVSRAYVLVCVCVTQFIGQIYTFFLEHSEKKLLNFFSPFEWKKNARHTTRHIYLG